MRFLEIERGFKIHNKLELKELLERIEQAGFLKVFEATQINYYLDFPNFLLYQNQNYYRFRYEFHPEFILLKEILAEGEFIKGEISLSKRLEDQLSKNELREQTSINFAERKVLENLFQIMLKLGFINSFLLIKTRQTFSLSEELNESEVHLELDTAINCSKYPAIEDFIALKDTFQICIEKKKFNEFNSAIFDRIMNELGFTPAEIVYGGNYLERYEKRMEMIKGV